MIRRYRYGRYALQAHEGHNSFARSIAGIAIIAFVLIGITTWLLRTFDVGNTIQRKGVTLLLEGEDTVSISFDGGDFKRAEHEQKIYPGDRIKTNNGSNAGLSFFDGSVMRLDSATDLSIVENYQGETSSEIALALHSGTLWIATPERQTFSGSIMRTVETPIMHVDIPSKAELVLGDRSIIVFSADGIGATIETEDSVIPVIVGEGQKLTLPADAGPDTDLYAFRAPLDSSAVLAPFVAQSRERKKQIDGGKEVSEPGTLNPTEALTVTNPTQGMTAEAGTVTVKGSVGSGVARIRINGYAAPIDEQRKFQLDLALPDEDEVDIHIVAVDATDQPLGEVHRTITRNRKPPTTPVITKPAKSGETYRTQAQRLLIEGTTGPDTIGINVNDYRLQLFTPGDGTWRYLASTSIDNLKPGRNVFTVTAINKGGYVSEAATLIILLEEGTEGVVAQPGTTSSSPTGGEATGPLPANDPLAPGTLHITAPSDGSPFTATGAFLIEGSTSPETASVWVNDYQLQLYAPGKTFWNYIADPALNTLKRGRNVYEIVVRNAEKNILDKLTYTVEY